MNPASLRRRATVALASFIATLFVTLLAPVVHPMVFELLCSVRGNQVISIGDTTAVGLDQHTSHDDHGAHCPLCMPTGATASQLAWDFASAQPLAHVQQGIPAARLASLVGAPLPARGPPLTS